MLQCTVTSIEWTESDDVILGCSKGRISHTTLPNLTIQKSVQMTKSNNVIAMKLSKDETHLAASNLSCTVEVFKWPSLEICFVIDSLIAPTKVRT